MVSLRMKKFTFGLPIFCLWLQCSAVAMQYQSDVERIEKRNADLQKVLGYDVLEREVITLGETTDSQKFISIITEIVRQIDELLVFIERQTDYTHYPMIGTLLINIASKLKSEQTKANSKFDEYINMISNEPLRSHVKQRLHDSLNITIR